MARPVVSDTAEELWRSLGAYNAEDESTGWQLLLACQAIATAFVEPVAELVSERNDRVSWEVLLDPENCPAEYLGWLSQWTGSRLTDNMSEAEQRAAITLPAGWSRGTPAAMEQAIKRTLTGAKTALIDERYTGSAYKLRVRTLASETPDTAATLAAVVSQKPVGIVLTFDGAVVGQDWDDVVSKYATWDAVVAAHSTWDSLVAELP